MASKTPYEMAEEILGLAQALVLELGGSDGGPSGDQPVELDLRAEVAEASAAVDETSDDQGAGSRKLVGTSWAPRSWT